MKHSKEHPRLRVAVVVFKGEQVLLVQHRKKGKEYWLLPGGGVEYGETLEQAAKRELWEETRLKIKLGPLVLLHDSIPKDQHRHIVNAVFRGSIVSGKAAQGETGILQAVRFFKLKELSRLVIYPHYLKNLLPQIKKNKVKALYRGNSWK